MEKVNLFETMKPSRALAKMALPTILSQVILLIYNLADIWFIGRTGDPYMIAASSIAFTIYLTGAAIASIFGVGGGSLMVRLAGEKKTDEARNVSSYSVAGSVISALLFSVLIFVFMKPLLFLLGTSENTFAFARQYIITTAVIGGLPTVLSISMSHLIRNAGYSKQSSIGIAVGSILNVAFDPLFMFVLLPRGNEVLGAGIATMLSNFISLLYFIIIFHKVKGKTVLEFPRRLQRIPKAHSRSLYSVGIPAAISVFLFDLVTMVINKLAVSYGDIALASMGIVLKLERLPINIGLGICLGMVPLIAYNYGSGNKERMRQFFILARRAILCFSIICAAAFWIFSDQVISIFISDDETIRLGAQFLKGRCFALPFMLIGYHIVNYMNAVNKGKISFMLALLRHVVLIIPIMLLMNYCFGLQGLIWSQLTADFANAFFSYIIFRKVDAEI